MQAYATVDDVIRRWRALKPDEMTRAETLLSDVSNALRVEAEKVGKDLDQMIVASPSYAEVVKSVVVDNIARMLMASTTAEPMVQESQSALGYSWSGTYLTPGGGLSFKRSELARLGLRRQRFGVVEFYGKD